MRDTHTYTHTCTSPSCFCSFSNTATLHSSHLSIDSLSRQGTSSQYCRPIVPPRHATLLHLLHQLAFAPPQSLQPHLTTRSYLRAGPAGPPYTIHRSLPLVHAEPTVIDRSTRKPGSPRGTRASVLPSFFPLRRASRTPSLVFCCQMGHEACINSPEPYCFFCT